jgi:hypothetical protein
MHKYTASKNGTEILAKDGKKIAFRVATGTLSTNAVAGILAAIDPEAGATEEELQALVAAAQARKGSVIPDDYRHQYGVHQNCGDGIAAKLREKAVRVVGKQEYADLDVLAEIASQNGIGDRFDGWMAKGLNNGMVRMNLGNVLRGKARRGEAIVGL